MNSTTTENPIPDALAVIVKQLRNDREYYRAWQSNIAMAFQDAMTGAGYRFPDLHALANEAAYNFLDNLMKSPTPEEDFGGKIDHTEIMHGDDR